MNYIELTIETTEEGVEAVAARLDMLGISQVSIIQGHDEIDRILRYTEKYWDYADESVLNKHPAVQAYIVDDGKNGEAERAEKAVRLSMEELKSMETDLGMALGSLEIKTRKVAEEDWANNWKAYFKPLPIGEKLLICPSWEKIPEGSTRRVLRIDPGMAFGTGSHHTTKMCLELLEKYMRGGSHIADLGCGSGILSIAAALLGAGKIYAVDIDPAAAKAAKENAELNGIGADKFFIRTGDILTDDALQTAVAARKYDVVAANIAANVLIAFAPVVPKLMKDGGIFISSGIIDDRYDEVVSAFELNGLKVCESRAAGGWRAIAAKKGAEYICL